MFDKEFLKTLTVLYVEDDITIQNSLGNILKKVFKEVIICNDGLEGLSNYKKYTNDLDVHFDVIISDINMPNMNGLEMIKEIKKLNPEIPSIITTAHGEADYLLEAIKINVNGYTLKPIDTKDLLMTVQHHCEIKKNQKIIAKNEKELSEYMEFINSIATILKVDTADNITEANPFFCGMIEQEEEDLIGQNIVNYIHQDAVPKAFKELRNTIKSGESWKGKLKFVTADDEIFFLRTTNIPRKNLNTNEVEGYISIGFLADEEEAEKKETISKAKTNIMEQKHKVLNLNKQVKTLKKKSNDMGLSREAAQTMDLLKTALATERKKSSDMYTQIEYYEKEMGELKKRLDNVAGYEQIKRVDGIKKVNDLMKENAKLKDMMIELQAEITRLKPKEKYV
jgi:PAS domain S-box-containing protein